MCAIFRFARPTGAHPRFVGPSARKGYSARGCLEGFQFREIPSRLSTRYAASAQLASTD